MWKHYLITAVRNLKRQKVFSGINITGLSLGIATFLILVSYVQYEFSYDTWFPNHRNVYRIEYSEKQNNDYILKTSRSHSALSTVAGKQVSEIQYITKAYYEECLLFNDRAKEHLNCLWVDSSFLNVFDLPLIRGDRNKALVAPFSVAISKSVAHTFFGNEDPIGKTVYFNEHVPLNVSAVYEDIPSNATLQHKFLISFTTLDKMLNWNGYGDFGGPWAFTFVSLYPQSNINAVNSKLGKIASDNISSLRTRHLTGSYSTRPITDTHFATGLTGDIEPVRNKTLLYALLSVAIFILIAAWVNYINLSLAQSFQRADEIVVRKVYGAGLSHITQQFMTEAFLISIITSVIGFSIYFLLQSFLSHYIATNFASTGSFVLTLLMCIPVIMLCTALIAIYPARVIAKYKPAFILKRQYNNGTNKNILQKSLVTFQLCLSVFTIGYTIIAFKQINYMRHFDVGFNADQTISLRGPASRNMDSVRYQHFVAFRNDVLSNSAFSSGTASMNIPGQELRFHDEGIRLQGGNNEKKQSYWISQIDDGYIGTFGLKLLAGRNIEERDRNNGCIVNESAAKALGFATPQQAINANLLSGKDKPMQIVGVMQDYHQESLRKKVEPVIFKFEHPYEFGYYTFRTKTASRGDALNYLQDVYKKHFPNDPFVFYFMDNFFAKQYESDVIFGKLLALFSIMSIVVASLGLFGLASLNVQLRTKEIGIRKVVGASVSSILLLLSKDYIKLTVIGFIIASPILYYINNQWLSLFSYHITLHWWMFVLPGLIVLLIAWGIVCIQSLKAANVNPVRTLRSE